MQPITSIREAELALEAFLPSNISRPAYSTEQVERFMDYIGDPQNQPRSIHIAGTSGKTSTAYYAAALLQQAGKKVGLLTSPHIQGLNERVQINLQPMPEAVFCSELTIFMTLVKKSGIVLTYSEILYAFGYWEFARERVDYIVIEVGMGGLLDATNVIDRADKIAVITDIGLDHTNVLGNTVEQITQHKAGIIRLRNTVFCHRQPGPIMAEIEKIARQRQADMHVIDQDDRTPTALPLFQQRNFSLALAAVVFALERSGRIVLSPEQIQKAAQVTIPARMEVFKVNGKTIVLDNAHNPQKLHALSESLAAQYPGQAMAFLVAFSSGGGRNLAEMTHELEAISTHMIVTNLPMGSKQRTGHGIADVLAAYRGKSKQGVPGSMAACRALLARPEPILVITGSTYLLEEVRPFVSAIQ